MVVLGSTGSIGVNSLLIANKFNIEVEALSCNKNVDLLNLQIAKFKPKFVCIGDESLVDQSLPIRRTTRFEKYPEADWNTKEVIELKTMTEMTRPIMRPINWE